AELRNAIWIDLLFVAESNRFELKDDLTGLVHALHCLKARLTAFLKRMEEVPLTPSFPLEFTTTGLPVIVTPKIPAIKVPFCVPCLPMRILPDSPAVPSTLAPISMVVLPV